MLSTIIAATDGPGNVENGPESFFGFMGVACALVFANIGSAYGTGKSGVGISYFGVIKPEGIIKAIIPVIMAGILGIYGLVVAVLLIQKSKLKFNLIFFLYQIQIFKFLICFNILFLI
jgi:V-type H+-transporting ATPase proteolipid subunit